MTISPAKAFLLFGGTQQFSASAYDQYNNLLPDMPFNRSTVNGGGSIDVGGMFSAGQTEGTYLDTVKAQTTQDENTRQATATVVIGPVLTVNATLQGGPRPAAGLDVPLTISFYNQATELNSTNITTATPEYVFTRADGEVIITDNDTENKIITLKAGGLPVGTFNITLFTPVRSLISGMARR